MFCSCSSLKSLDLSHFNTDKVIRIEYMFFECSSLNELNLNNFKTNNVTDMTDMFYGCSKELKLKIKIQFKNFKKEAFKIKIKKLLNFDDYIIY